MTLSDRALREVTTVCAAFDVDGLRADLVTAKAALALAAWDGRTDVSTDDVRTAARLALPHRRRRTPFEAPGLDEQRLEEALEDAAGPDDEPPPPSGGPGDQDPAASEDPSATGHSSSDAGTGETPERPRSRPRSSRPRSRRSRRTAAPTRPLRGSAPTTPATRSAPSPCACPG